MYQNMTEDLIKEKNMKIKRSSNRLLIGVFVVFIFSYFIFFTSLQWMPTAYKDINVTKLGSVIEGNDRKITLLEWDYSERENKMEIVMDMQNMSVDGINDYEFIAVERNKGNLNTKIVFEDTTMFVVEITEIPRKFAEISLRMESKNKDEEFIPIKLYTSKKDVSKVDSIPKKSSKEYSQAACDSRIKIAKDEISSELVKIKENKTIITNAEAQIEKIKQSEKFQTDEEKMASLEALSKLKNDIQNAKVKIEDYENNVRQLNDKIEMQKAKKGAY